MGWSLVWAIILAAVLGGHALAQADPLVMWISSAADKFYYENMAELYRQQVDPDFNVQIIAYGFTELPDRLSVAIRTGVNTPDIVQLEETFFGIYLGDRVPFVDLTDRIREAGLDAAIPKARLDLFTYKGRIYGVPQSLAAIVLYYRRDIFEEYGIRPADIDTWDEFVQVARRLSGNNRYMLALDPSYWYVLSRQRGVDLFDSEGNPQVTHPIMVDTLEFLMRLKREGLAELPPRGSIFDPPFLSLDLAEGRFVTVLGADWYGLDMLKGLTPQMEGKWGVMPLPRWTDAASDRRRTSTYAGQGLLIYEGSDKVEEAWRFIAWVLGTKEPNVQRYLQGNSFPAYRPAWDDPRLFEPDPYFGGQALAQVIVQVADEVPPQNASPLRPLIFDLWHGNYWNKAMAAEQSAREILAELERALMQF